MFCEVYLASKLSADNKIMQLLLVFNDIININHF